MLGGGTWVTQNKILPGAYINFVRASGLSNVMTERGYVAVAMKLSWGEDGKMMTVPAEEFARNSVKLFGFEYTSEEAKPLREIFKNAKVAYIYKLMKNGAKASNSVAEALYKGSAGAKIATEILAGTESGTFDVNIFFDNTLVWTNNVKTLDELTAQDNGFVKWTLSSLATDTKTLLTGTSLDGDAITATEHEAFIKLCDSYQFNALICASSDSAIQDLYITTVKTSREDDGKKYQVVLYNNSADYEGVVNVKNSLDCVWWVGGAIAGCAINASNTNKKYNGEYDIFTDYSKYELEQAIKHGQFTFHRVGDEVRCLKDINSLTTVDAVKSDDFKANQTIRVLDQIAMDVAKIFNDRYLGKIPNDKAGRISLWNDITKHHEELETLRAIEDFDPSDVTVELGDNKQSVLVNDKIWVTNCMEYLYCTILVE